MTRGLKVAHVAIPVFAGTEEAGRLSTSTMNFHGTAFPFGGSMLLTAFHVAANAEASGNRVLIGWPPPRPNKPFEFMNASVVQTWPHVDMAAIMVPGTMFPPLSWNASQLPLLTQVRAYGFPHGYEPRALYHRAFAGPIVGHRTTYKFSGQPEVYELQFAAPLGLSGAALLTGDLEVAGCVVGNATSMLRAMAAPKRSASRSAVRRTTIGTCYTWESRYALRRFFNYGSTAALQFTTLRRPNLA